MARWRRDRREHRLLNFPEEKVAIFRIPVAWEGEWFEILQKPGVEYGNRTVPMPVAARRAVEKLRTGT